MSSKANARKRKSPPEESEGQAKVTGANSSGMPQDDTASSCPYLDTIQRSMLDFDLEHSCSVSLQSGPHIYGCLVCGKFFRGRGQQTPAYTHSVDEGHFVFVHLSNSKFYCLPDNYEIRDPSLSDISAALHPTFKDHEIQAIDQNTALARDLFGRRYLPGFVGLNNLNKTDCINATVQALAHVPPLRDFFLNQTPQLQQYLSQDMSASSSSNSKHAKKFSNKQLQVISSHRMSQHVTLCFGELVRKIWSDKRFKSHIDPHVLIQAITVASKKKFRVGHQMEAGEFMAWLLHQLHLGLGGSQKKAGSSIIHTIFQGTVEVTTRQAKATNNKDDQEEDDRGGSDAEEEQQAEYGDVVMAAEEETPQNGPSSGESMIEETTIESHFLQLTLDISEKPLFKDDDGGLVIPQEPLVTVLKKFDGVSFADIVSRAGKAQRRRYKLRELPPYLILHLARFKTNRHSKEKNPTIVVFPVKNLDLSDYVFPKHKQKLPTEDEVRGMSVKQLKALLVKHGQPDNSVEKSELLEKTLTFVTQSLPDLLADKYDLVANITHEIPADVGREGQHDPLQDGSYKCHVQHRGTKQWYEMQDLHVKEIMPQLIGLSESYLLIFERKSALSKTY